MQATAVFAMPIAIRSRFNCVFRFQGSSMSIALALSIDSSEPISENISTHFQPITVPSELKSG